MFTRQIVESSRLSRLESIVESSSLDRVLMFLSVRQGHSRSPFLYVDVRRLQQLSLA
jgi:hypothetical protein